MNCKLNIAINQVRQFYNLKEINKTKMVNLARP